MGAIDQIININISQQTNAVQQASFAIPLIIGPTATSWGPTEYAHTYFDPSEMLEDGFTTSDPEYIYALELFMQDLSPTQFVVGYRAPAEAQVNTIAVNTLTPLHEYKFTLDGIVMSYTATSSDTQQSILTALNADIVSSSLPVSGVVTGTGGSALLTITADTEGDPQTYSAVDSLLTLAETNENYGIQDDINNIISVNDTWYGMCLTQGTDADVEQAADLIESLKKIYIAISSNAAIPTSSSTDIASVLKGQSLARTALMYTVASNVTEGKEAAWLGGQLPATPGSNNWAFKTLVGCTPDSLSGNAQAILIGNPVAGTKGKNANIYQTVGGQNITQMATMAGGQFIDITVGIDWLEAELMTNVFRELVTAAKIPYTDKGTDVLISAVNQALQQGVTNGLIDGNSPITVTAPLVASVPANQRANRIAPTISFTCRLAGAFNAVVINGTVTV